MSTTNHPLPEGRLVGTPASWSRRLLRERGFVNVTNLPSGDGIITAKEEDRGRWGYDDRFVAATTEDLEVWITPFDPDPARREKQLDCLRAVCRRGGHGGVPECGGISIIDFANRVSNPDYNLDPRTSFARN